MYSTGCMIVHSFGFPGGDLVHIGGTRRKMKPIHIVKNIMKSSRNNKRSQYTISIPDTVGQLLEVGTRKILYMIQRQPGHYTIGTINPRFERQEERSIFPNGCCHYFTLPMAILEDMTDEQINQAMFIIDFNQVNEVTQQPGRITLHIQ